QGVQDVFLTQPSAPCRHHSVAHQFQMIRAVRVGGNDDFHSPIARLLQVPVAEVEAFRVGVQFQDYAVFLCCRKDLLKVENERVALQNLAARGVSQDPDVGIGESLQDAGC